MVEVETSREAREGQVVAEAQNQAVVEVQNKTDPAEVVLAEALRSRTLDTAVVGLEARVAYHRWADHHHACDRSIESAGQTWAEAQMERGRKGSS